MIVEFVGIFAVVLSLIFIIFELNQTQASMEAAAMAARNDRNMLVKRLGIEYGIATIIRNKLNWRRTVD